MELTGKLYSVGNINNVSVTFRKRSFVIEYRNPTDGAKWRQYAQFELTQADVLEIDKHQIGDDITITFEIKGNKYDRDGEERIFTSLHAMKIEGAVKDIGGAISDPRLLDDDMGVPNIPRA